jgi:hypothetical protein
MPVALEREMEIEDLRNHSAETINVLRDLLLRGACARPDPKRAGFYELEHASTVYYIHVSPVTGKILLLATWPSAAARPQQTRRPQDSQEKAPISGR